MQVTSYAGGALGYSLRDLAFRSPTTRSLPNAAPQQQPAVSGDAPLGDTGTGQTRRLRDNPAEGSDRALHRMERLGRLLDRLIAVSGGSPGGSGVLVAGPAGSHSGIAVSIPAERPNGTYLDLHRGPNSWMRFHGTALADTVAMVASKVGTVDSGEGADEVSILARRVNGIATGQGADALSVVARSVRNIATDPDDTTPGAPDAVAIAALRVNGVSTGGGDDAVAILGLQVSDISTGSGNDAISVIAEQVNRIDGGAGDDVIAVQLGVGDASPSLDPTPPQTAEDRMLSAVNGGVQVDGGSGSDTIAVTTDATIGLSGGTGNDSLTLNGGTAGLFYALGDGDDTVALGAGTEALVQISADLGAYMVQTDADSLTLTFSTGSITFTGLEGSGAIGLRTGDGEVLFLHPGTATNLDMLA